MNLSDLCVRTTEGIIDVEQTLAKVAETLQVLVEKEAVGMAAISQAAHAVFDQHTGPLSMPVVCSYTFQNLGLPPSEYVDTCKAIALYVRTSPQFKVAKGKGGGVSRL